MYFCICQADTFRNRSRFKVHQSQNTTLNRPETVVRRHEGSIQEGLGWKINLFPLSHQDIHVYRDSEASSSWVWFLYYLRKVHGEREKVY